MPTIRQATADDVSAVARAVERAYELFVPRLGMRPDAMDADHASRVWEGVVWVAVDEGPPERVIGAIVLVPGRDHLLVETVAVDPERQGEGVGGGLLAFAEEEALRRGVRDLRLSTHEEMTESLRFSSGRGWQETGRGVQRGLRRVFLRKRLAPSEG